MCEISVIVPVFNVEDYLNECLDSLINQSFSDIEIICVNDGSTDKSLEILENYQKKDRRVKVISQDNLGLGAARNRGLLNAKGKFIYFIDSDDYIDSDALEKLYKNITDNDSDVVLFKFKSFGGVNASKKGEGFKIDKIYPDVDYSSLIFTYKDVKRHVLNSYYSACIKFYKKEFLDQYGDFTFTENIYFEDVLFHVKTMIRASKISFINENLYNYRLNDDSIINSNTNGCDIFKVIDMVEDFLKKNNYFTEFESEFKNFKIAQILLYIRSTNSDRYYDKARDELMGLEIDVGKVEKRLVSDYNLVLDNKNYSDFLNEHSNKIPKSNSFLSRLFKKILKK